MTASDARSHLRYSAWASHKVLAAIQAVGVEELSRNTGVSHASLLGTLTHIHFADWIWYSRAVAPIDRPVETLEALTTDWPVLMQKWIDWADALTDADIGRVIEYKSLDGKPFHNTAGQIVLHLVNHATLHRGQAMAMLRQLKIKPPATDLLFYYRELERQ